MLVLSRKRNQSIVIGDGPDKVTITLIDLDGRDGKVRLGIEAPRSISVLRGELTALTNRRYCDACRRQVMSHKFHEIERDEVCQILCHRHFEE